jgi:F-type H+-transporting ATPase subunit b
LPPGEPPEWPMAEKKTSARTEVPGEHKGAFPPFQKETFASQLVWLALTFILLYVLMAKVALPRIGAIFAARAQRIADDLAEAQKHQKRAEASSLLLHARLDDARNRAQTIAGETRAALNTEAEATRKRLEDELNAKLAAAERTIEATKAAAMANVRGIAIEAAAAIVERLIGTAPASTAVEAAVDSALKS